MVTNQKGLCPDPCGQARCCKSLVVIRGSGGVKKGDGRGGEGSSTEALHLGGGWERMGCASVTLRESLCCTREVCL